MSKTGHAGGCIAVSGKRCWASGCDLVHNRFVLPERLDEMIRGFQASRIILTAIELDLFAALGEASTAADLAARLHTDLRATGILLNALAALDLLVKDGETFRNTPVVAQWFGGGSHENARLALMHTVHLWDLWSQLTATVRTGTPAPRGDDSRWTDSFIAAMDFNSGERAPEVARVVGASSVRRMLDIGGGSGAYSIAFARESESLQADVLDLPAVIPLMQRYIDRAGMSSRVHPRPGDLRDESYGEGYDLVFISSICHMLDPDENRDMLRKACAALAPGGRLVVKDFLLDPDRTKPFFAALFAVNMLVATSGGNSYTEEEYASWLKDAGCVDVHRVELWGPSDLVMGTRPQ